MKQARLLFGSVILLCLASAAKGQSNWPDADLIIGVSIVVFEQANAPAPHTTQVGLTTFPTATQLPKLSDFQSDQSLKNRSLKNRLSSKVTATQVNSADPPTQPWSMQNWLHFMHAGVLSELDQPLTGPPLPPKPSSPLLNAPLLMRESAAPPEGLRRAAGRIDASIAYSLSREMHWYQVLDRDTTAPKISVADRPTQTTTPWLAPIVWVESSGKQPIYADQLDGYVQLTQDQFTRAEVNLCLHKTHQQTMGPLQPSNLAPTGYRVTCLEANRAIEPNQWNYFDSETLGVLLKVSMR